MDKGYTPNSSSYTWRLTSQMSRRRIDLSSVEDALFVWTKVVEFENRHLAQYSWVKLMPEESRNFEKNRYMRTCRPDLILREYHRVNNLPHNKHYYSCKEKIEHDPLLWSNFQLVKSQLQYLILRLECHAFNMDLGARVNGKTVPSKVSVAYFQATRDTGSKSQSNTENASKAESLSQYQMSTPDHRNIPFLTFGAFAESPFDDTTPHPPVDAPDKLSHSKLEDAALLHNYTRHPPSIKELKRSISHLKLPPSILGNTENKNNKATTSPRPVPDVASSTTPAKPATLITFKSSDTWLLVQPSEEGCTPHETVEETTLLAQSGSEDDSRVGKNESEWKLCA
ncbi:MAG: hypothetical protein Q9190_007097 [Brigantiaea leucoxantha]